jgi:hypothetical protein
MVDEKQSQGKPAPAPQVIGRPALLPEGAELCARRDTAYGLGAEHTLYISIPRHPHLVTVATVHHSAFLDVLGAAPKLREALRPFADLASGCPVFDTLPDSHHLPPEAFGSVRITAGDVRAARAALALAAGGSLDGGL